MVVMTNGGINSEKLFDLIKSTEEDDVGESYRAICQVVNIFGKMPKVDKDTVMLLVRLFFLLKEKEHYLSLFSVMSCLAKLSEKGEVRDILVMDTCFMSAVCELAWNPSARIWRKACFMLAVFLKPDTLKLERTCLQNEAFLKEIVDSIAKLLQTKDVFEEMFMTALLSLSFLNENSKLAIYIVKEHFKIFEIFKKQILGTPCILAKYQKMFGRVADTSSDEIKEKLDKIKSILSL